MSRDLPDLGALARPGALIAVRARPGARRNAIDPGAPPRISVTVPAADGAANEAVRRLLAQALGVAPGRLTLVRGHASRNKLFRLE